MGMILACLFEKAGVYETWKEANGEPAEADAKVEAGQCHVAGGEGYAGAAGAGSPAF